MKYFVNEKIKKLDNGKCEYQLNFSDNSYLMIFTDNYMECLKVKDIMKIRMENFINRKTDMLKTSDLGFEYVRK